MATNRLLEDERGLIRMGQAARDRVIERFSWHTVAERTLSFYQSLL